MIKPLHSILVFSVVVLFAQEVMADVQRACCRKQPRWYAAISGSAVFLDDTEITHTEAGYINPDGQTFHVGFGFSGALGYRIYPNIRAELEGAFRRSEVDSTTASALIGPSGGTVRQSSIAIMANGYYDWHNSSRFTPYIGAGIGAAHVTNPRLYGSEVTGYTKKIKGWVMAYQFMTGLSYQVNTGFSPMEVSLGYRYFTGEDVETTLGSLAPGKHGVNNDSHNIELGGKIFF